MFEMLEDEGGRAARASLVKECKRLRRPQVSEEYVDELDEVLKELFEDEVAKVLEERFEELFGKPL